MVNKGLFLFLVIFIFAVHTTIPSAEAVPPPSTSPKRRNVYAFASAFADTGAFRRFFGNQPGRDPIVAGQPINPSPSYYGPPLNSPRVDIYGPLNRFSDGRCWVDFFCEEFGLTLLDAYNLNHLPTNKRNFVNFAIGGASMEGNAFNSLTPNSDYGMISGPYSYLYQIEYFLSLKDNLPSNHISPDDIFILGEIGGNDVPAIAYAALYNPSNIPTYINNFVTSTLTAIQMLYDAGARKMMVTHADTSVWTLQPAAWKSDPNGGVIDGLVSITNSILDIFFGALNNQIENSMPELEINLVPIGEPVQNWLIFIDNHGVRRSIATDVGDPRGGFPTLPFPTYYDMLMARGVKLNDAFFYDDLHPTEHTFAEYTKIYSEHLQSYFD